MKTPDKHQDQCPSGPYPTEFVTVRNYSLTDPEIIDVVTGCPMPNQLAASFKVRATAALPGTDPARWGWWNRSAADGHPRAIVWRKPPATATWLSVGTFKMNETASGSNIWITPTISIAGQMPGTLIKADVEAHYWEKHDQTATTQQVTLNCP